MKISIPPIEQYRAHLIMVLSYIIGHLLMVEAEMLQPTGIEILFNRSMLETLKTKMEIKGMEKKLTIAFRDVLLLYGCFIAMNKLLVSQYDEAISSMILPHLGDDHHLRKFEAFRNEMLSINSHLIADAEIKFPKKKQILLLKEKLLEIDVL